MTRGPARSGKERVCAVLLAEAGQAGRVGAAQGKEAVGGKKAGPSAGRAGLSGRERSGGPGPRWAGVLGWVGFLFSGFLSPFPFLFLFPFLLQTHTN